MDAFKILQPTNRYTYKSIFHPNKNTLELVLEETGNAQYSLCIASFTSFLH